MNPDPTDIAFDPNSPEFVRDPYPIYERLRNEDPVHRMQNGCWVLTRYEDIEGALKDVTFSNMPHPFSIVGPHNRERFPAARIANELMAFLDPPDHGRVRKPFQTRFHERLRNLKPLVQESVEARFAKLPRNEPVDLLRGFANPLAVEVICGFIGFPVASADALTEWSRQLFYLFHAIPNQEVLARVNHSLLEFEEFVRKELRERRESPADDLLSLLLDVEELSEDEIIHNVMLIAADGIGNVDVGLALSICTLLHFPDEYERLRAEPGLARPAVAECLRYDSPAQYQGRILSTTKEVGGRELPAKSIVLLALASGNRDESFVGDAGEFRIDRQGFRNLSFGRGVHACLGAALVTLQFESVFEKLASTGGRMSLEPGPIRWTARAGHRWPETLPVTFG